MKKSRVPRRMVCSLDDGTCSHSKPHLENSDCQTHHKCIPVESACDKCNDTGICGRDEYGAIDCDCKDEGEIEELDSDNNAHIASKLNEVIRKVNKLEEGKV